MQSSGSPIDLVQPRAPNDVEVVVVVGEEAGTCRRGNLQDVLVTDEHHLPLSSRTRKVVIVVLGRAWQCHDLIISGAVALTPDLS